MAERKQRLASLRPYLGETATALGLTQWTVTLVDDPPDDENMAECRTRRYQWEAQIRLSDDAISASREDLRITIVHELLHLWTAGMHDLILRLESPLGTAAYWGWEIGFSRAHEFCVDGLSRSLAKFFPLPPVDPSE